MSDAMPDGTMPLTREQLDDRAMQPNEQEEERG